MALEAAALGQRDGGICRLSARLVFGVAKSQCPRALSGAGKVKFLGGAMFMVGVREGDGGVSYIIMVLRISPTARPSISKGSSGLTTMVV